MGYRSTAEGHLDITPPIPWGDIKDSPYHPDRVNRDGNWREIQIELARDVVDTDEGQITTIHATGVVPVEPGERMKRYDLEDQLRDLINRHPGHTFTGAITCLGEEGDRWRYVVRDGKIVHETARVAWPSEGSEGLAQALARHIRVDFSDMTAGTPIVGAPYVIALAYGYSTSGIAEPDRERLDHELAERLADLSSERLDRISAMAHRLAAAVDTERDERLDQLRKGMTLHGFDDERGHPTDIVRGNVERDKHLGGDAP